MPYEGSVEREKEREATGPDDPGSAREAWAVGEIRSDLAAVGLKFWGLDWESLERRPPEIGKRYRAERQEVAR
jgi:hypothetical protein